MQTEKMRGHIHHIGLLVSDIDMARHFYTDILGLNEVKRPNFLIKGIWYELGLSMLHIMLHEKPKIPHIHPLNETVQAHFALSITSSEMSKVLKRLHSFDIKFIAEPSSPLGGVAHKTLFSTPQVCHSHNKLVPNPI